MKVTKTQAGVKSKCRRRIRRSRLACDRRELKLTWCLNAGPAGNDTLLSSAWAGDAAYSRILSSSCSRRPTSFSSVAMRASLVSRMAVSVPLDETPTFCVGYAFSNSICNAFRLSLVAFRSCVGRSHRNKRKIAISQSGTLVSEHNIVQLLIQNFSKTKIKWTGIQFKNAFSCKFSVGTKHRMKYVVTTTGRRVVVSGDDREQEPIYETRVSACKTRRTDNI